MENKSQIHEQVHDLANEFSERIIKKMQEFIQTQTELMEFRIFSSILKNDKEVNDILKFHNKGKNDRWESLMRKFKGNKEKVIESYYN